MNRYDLVHGSYKFDSFIKWIEEYEDHTTELGWYDLDGFCVDMDVGYFFEGIKSFRKYFEKRLKEFEK